MIQCVRACERGGNTWWYKSKGWMRTGKVIEERLVSPLFRSQPAHLSFTLILPHRVEWETGREMEKVCSLDHTPRRPGMTEEAVDHHQNNSSVKAVGTSPLRSVQRTPQLLFQLLCRAESQWWERAKGAWEQGKWLKNVSSRPSFTLNLPISPSLSSYHLELRETGREKGESVLAWPHASTRNDRGDCGPPPEQQLC